MRGNRLRAAGTLQHKQLGQDGDALEPDAESPEDFGGSVVGGEEDCEDRGATDQVLDAEGVLVGVVGGLVVVEHEVDDVGLGGDEDDFEGCVPERGGGVCPEEVCGWLLVVVLFLLWRFGEGRVIGVSLRRVLFVGNLTYPGIV